MDVETLGDLILQELKLIRKEMKEEFRKLCNSIQFFQIDQGKGKRDVFNHFGKSLLFERDLKNDYNQVELDHRLNSAAVFSLNSKSNTSTEEECEISSSPNIKSETEFDNAMHNEKQTSNIKSADTDFDHTIHNEEQAFAEEVFEQASDKVYYTTERADEPFYPVVVDVKEFCESRSPFHQLSSDFYPGNMENTEDVEGNSVNDDRYDNFTHQDENQSFLKALSSYTLNQDRFVHLKSSRSMIDFSCKLCSLTFPNYSNYLLHMKEHTQNQDIEKSYSNKALENEQTNLFTKMNQPTNKRQYICKHCNKGFFSNHELKIHMRIISKLKLHNCSICNTNFPNKKSLTLHSRTHIKKVPYKCSICQKVFPVKKEFIKHTQTHAEKDLFKCVKCKLCFSSASELTEHTRIHIVARPFKCDVCNRTFSRKINLINHSRTHTGEKPYKCSFCNKTFSVKSNLTTHIRTHTGEKPYTCYICSKSFSIKTTLTAHIRTHTGEKPYKCDICNRSFAKKMTLNTHARIHLRELSV